MNKQDEDKATELVDKTHLYEEGIKYLHTDRVMCETLLEMAAWKEQQMIEKAVKFLERQKRLSNVSFDEDFIYFFKEQMMEEN